MFVQLANVKTHLEEYLSRYKRQERGQSPLSYCPPKGRHYFGGKETPFHLSGNCIKSHIHNLQVLKLANYVYYLKETLFYLI